jgi:hypothetical protein
MKVYESRRCQCCLIAQSRQSTRHFSPAVRIGTTLPPHPQASVSSPPLIPAGGTQSLTGEGVGGPNSDKGTHTVVL